MTGWILSDENLCFQTVGTMKSFKNAFKSACSVVSTIFI